MFFSTKRSIIFHRKYLCRLLPVFLALCLTLMAGCNGASPSQPNGTLPGTQAQTSTVPDTAPEQTTATTQKQVTPGETQQPIISGSLKVHFLDVGQADSMLIETPGGKSMLIDAGNNADSDMVVSYIKNKKINKIDVLVGTHPHEDHIGGMDVVIKSFDIGKIYMPKASSTTKTFEDVLNALKAKGLKVTTAAAGVSIDLDKGTGCEILAPIGSGYGDINNYSVVIKLTFGDTTFLFAGDAEELSEKEMLNKGYDLKADVLKIGHHGSSSSTSAAFLKAVAPEYAVICVGKENSYGHPTKETLDKLVQAKIQVLRTDINGTIIAVSDGKTVTFDKEPTAAKPQTPSSGSKNDSADKSGQAATPKTNTAVVPKPSENKDITVYITNSGTKYHREGCRFLSKSKIPISLDKAKASYDACSVCKPPT